MNDIIIVDSIDEITQCDVKYAHSSKPSKWIQIDKDGEKEFCVFGFVCGNQPTSITTSNWNQVKDWKTFNGVIRSLKKYSEEHNWGLSHWSKK